LKEDDIPQAPGAVAPNDAAVPGLQFRMGGIKCIQTAANHFRQSMLSFQQDDDPIPVLFHVSDDAPNGEDLIEIFLIEEGFIFIGEPDQVGSANGNGCRVGPEWRLRATIEISI